MTALLQIGLANAAFATVLACMVALLAMKVRRPALIHALWIIVLLKLVTPPLIQVAIEIPFTVEDFSAFVDPTAGAAEKAAPQSAGDDTSLTSATQVSGHSPVSPAGGAQGAASADSTKSGAVEAVMPLYRLTQLKIAMTDLATLGGKWLLRNAVAIIIWVWLTGAVVWFFRQGITAVRFSRRLSLAIPAPVELQRRADELASAMGLSYHPPVLIVRDVISPMLWGIGRKTRLLIPLELLARLESGARETLIAHELAHFRRGDHWVRAFELAVSGLYWWHPVVWWARNEIEIAEEECCDAWVIEQFTTTPRCYAEALLETIDFLSAERLVLPPAASGLGHVPFLRRRLTAIMCGAAPKSMSGSGWLAVATVALFSLPCHPFPMPAIAALPSMAVADSFASRLAAAIADVNAFAALQRELTEALTLEMPQAPLLPPTPAEELPGAVARSSDRRYTITRHCTENSVFFQDLSTGKTLDLSEYHIQTVAFSSDNRLFATGGFDRSVRLWNSSSGEMRTVFTGHAGSVQAVAFARNGKVLVSASRDGTIKLWDVAHEAEITTLVNKTFPANCLAVSSDGRWLAVGSGSWMSFDEGHVTLWNLETGLERVVLNSERAVGMLAFKPDGNLLLAGDWNGQVTFWDIAEQRCIGRTLPHFKDAIAEAQFSPDTHALARIGVEDIYRASALDEPRELHRENSLLKRSAEVDLNVNSEADSAVVDRHGPEVNRDRDEPVNPNATLVLEHDIRALERAVEDLEGELPRGTDNAMNGEPLAVPSNPPLPEGPAPTKSPTH